MPAQFLAGRCTCCTATAASGTLMTVLAQSKRCRDSAAELAAPPGTAPPGQAHQGKHEEGGADTAEFADVWREPAARFVTEDHLMSTKLAEENTWIKVFSY